MAGKKNQKSTTPKQASDTVQNTASSAPARILKINHCQVK